MPLARGRRPGLLPGGQVRVFILGDGVGDKVHAIRRGEILVLLQLFDLIADVFFGFLRVPLLSGFFRPKASPGAVKRGRECLACAAAAGNCG